MPELPSRDLDSVLEHTPGLWDALRGQRVFLTGGTGFFGRWLVESFLHANAALQLNASLCVLSRDPSAFLAKEPHLARAAALNFHAGDMTSFTFPSGTFAHIIHAAVPVVTTPNPDLLRMFDADVRGTRHVLDFARVCGAQRVVYTSSGAVYGRQPPELSHVPEDYPGAPPTTDAATQYGQSKRVCEYLCTLHAKNGLHITLTRSFAFAGPLLPLDLNFAIGNFVRDALAGGPIHIGGDGTPLRSYLYAADLAAWLWTILLRGQSGRVYNVGSDDAVNIADLARDVADVVAPNVEIRIAQKPVTGRLPARYVPSIERARNELGLRVWTQRREAIRRMAEYARKFMVSGS